MKNMNYPIDAVITWVDGEDSRHKAKRMEYGNRSIFKADDVAGSTRFASVGEIFYCVASLNRFAPWLNKIYIVTDEQDPKVEEFINRHFPEKHIPVEIVDHKEIFRGYEEYLPTFNSISIESMTWRIPGLSEHYIEFNDDFLLTAPTKPEDFFTTDGKVVCYGKKYSSLLVRITRLTKYRKNGNKIVSFKETMCNAARLLGHYLSFIKLYHTPRALLKSVFEEYFSKHPENLRKNISHRFRCSNQYNVQEIQYLILRDSARCELRRAYDNLLYLKPKKNKPEYTIRKLELFSSKPGFKFACINSLDQTTEDNQKMIIKWIERRIGLDTKIDK